MESVLIHSPVKGRWAFMNPPGHHPDAKDFVAVNSRGLPYRLVNTFQHLFLHLNVTSTFAWGQEVYSPFSGSVVDIANKQEDREKLNLLKDFFVGLVLAKKHQNKNINYFLGNFVIIESSEGIYALLAHLKKDSILVKTGQSIEAGEIIGRVGNSGNTIQPHLHFHLMRNNDPKNSIPVPFLFIGYEVKKSGKQKMFHQSLPGNFKAFNV